MAGEAIEDHLKERSTQLLLIIMPFKSLMACQMRVMLYFLLAVVLALLNKPPHVPPLNAQAAHN